MKRYSITTGLSSNRSTGHKLLIQKAKEPKEMIKKEITFLKQTWILFNQKEVRRNNEK